MAFAIGLRFYRLSLRRRGERENLEIGPGGEPVDLHTFVEHFINSHTETTTDAEAQRSWFLAPQQTPSIRTLHGHIAYGTHGFESDFKDLKTKKSRFKRKASDLEEIPLYYQFWSPENQGFAMMAFQSFQGRSCVSYVRTAMINDFKASYPNHVLLFNVIAPSKTMLDQAPVKTVTFHKPVEGGDRMDRYGLAKKTTEIDYEITLRARKRGAYIAIYKDLREQFSTGDDGLIEFNGDQFESVKADVQFGGRRRTVGVFGVGYDAGLIDVTEEVERDTTGHPKLASIESQVDDLMGTFYDSLAG